MSRPLFKVGERMLTVAQIEAAVGAALALVDAYDEGERSGGSVSWEAIDSAHALALCVKQPPADSQG